ncbi:MAG: dipeptidase [Chthoniobacterales bacterium]
MTETSTNHLNRARELLADTIAVDLHSCPTYNPRSKCLPELRRYRDAGVKCVHLNVGDSDVALPEQIALLAAFRGFVKSNPNEFLLVRSVADIERAAADGKLAICFDLEGARAFADDLALIQLFYDLGVRWMLPVYNTRNQVGGGCHDEVDEGLTDFGREFLREMDRVGMIKCCSHCGYRTAREILEMTEVPTIFSHSNARRLVDHPRNIPDELMRACAATGGLVGINGIGVFLNDKEATSQSIVRHIDYVVQQIGAEHVAIALDSAFDMPDFTAKLAANPAFWPTGLGYRSGMRMAEPEQWPEIIAGLLGLGYSDQDVSAIAGENYLRVARAVWK